MSQHSRHSNLQKKASSRGSLQGQAQAQLHVRRPSGASAASKGEMDARSYHSQTMSQRRPGANASNMMEDAGLNVLPDIDQHKSQTLNAKSSSRVQSATKRSSASLRVSQQLGDQKKGPIKAFQPMPDPSQSYRADEAEGADDDRFE